MSACRTTKGFSNLWNIMKFIMMMIIIIVAETKIMKAPIKIFTGCLGQPSLREKCSYSELFWSVFFRIRTEYGEIRSFSPYSVRMRENTDQNNCEYGHFSRNASFPGIGSMNKFITFQLPAVKSTGLILCPLLFKSFSFFLLMATCLHFFD